MYLSIITLNVNGLNAPIKRHRVAEWIRKQDLPVLGYCKLCCYEHWGAQILLDWCKSHSYGRKWSRQQAFCRVLLERN